MPGAGAGRPPVLLVPGYANSVDVLHVLGRSLDRDGFDTHVVALPGHGTGDLHEQRRVILEAVDRVRANTGSATVDIVALSSGGFSARAAAQFDGGNPAIRRVVTVATTNAGMHHGALTAVVRRIAPPGVRQILRGAPFIEQLHATRHAADVVSIGTTGFDLVCCPPSAVRIPDRPFVAVDSGRRIGPLSRVTHAHIVTDPVAYEAIRAALLQPAPS
ncbi:MAG: estB [Thermoleophilia bacterium]|nr:estB [Thermoleophilia bacterium]